MITLKYCGVGLETETGRWHDFEVVRDGEVAATCCMFIWAVDGVIDEDGSESEVGRPDCNGLHYGDGADRSDEINPEDYQAEALALI